MKRKDLDLLIIASEQIPEERKGFVDFEQKNLFVDGKKMHLENLITYIQNGLKFPHPAQTKQEQLIANEYKVGKLNGLYLYDYCTKRGLNCALIANLFPENPNFKRYMEQNPKCIAISTTFMLNIKQVKAVTSFIRTFDRNIPIIAGGPLVYNNYLLYNLFRNDSNYDIESPKKDCFFINKDDFYSKDIDYFVIDAQGEKTLVKLVHAIKHKRIIEEISNLAFYRNGKLCFTRRDPEANNIDENIISWDTMDEELLPSLASIRTSVSCPNKCKFCNWNKYRKYVIRSTESVIEELRRLQKRKKTRCVNFVNDTLLSKEIKGLCQEMINQKIHLPWFSLARIDAVTPDNVKLLRETNCILLKVGMESGDDTILKNINKRETTKDYIRVFELCNREGIDIQAFIFIGFPGETEETVNNTIRFLNSIPTQGPGTFDYLLSQFYFLPLSPIYLKQERERFGLTGYMEKWKHNTMDHTEVNRLTKKIFSEVANDVFILYTEESPEYGGFFPNLDRAKFKKIKSIRQKLQRAIIKGEAEPIRSKLWNELIQEISSLKI